MPGLALLLLRTMLGLTAFVQGLSYLDGREFPSLSYLLIGVAALLVGSSLLIGFLTPINAFMMFLGSILAALTVFPQDKNIVFESGLSAVYVCVSAIATVLLGPGAFSLDARLFGRREIIIPGRSTLPKS